MDSLCEKKIVSYPVITDRIFDSSRAMSKLSSNLSLNFDILSDCKLPCNTKLEIIESKFEYCIDKIEKKILLDGHRIEANNKSMNDIICMKKEYINLVDSSCKSMLLDITQFVEIELSIEVKIKGVAYINNCKKICFEAYGVGKDKVDSIIISNIFVPNFSACNIDTYIKAKNNLIGVANPEYIYLSPLYDCNGNIEFLLGNVFVNYCLSLNLTSLIPSNLTLLACKQ